MSKIFPTGGIDGTNKYTLETAIAKIPASLRSVGIKCSFLDEGGELETWEYQNSGQWKQAGAKKISQLENMQISFSMGQYFDVNGKLVSYAASCISELLYIPTKDLTLRNVWNRPGVGYGIVFLDEKGEYLGYINNAIDDPQQDYVWEVSQVSIPDNAKYFVVQFQNTTLTIESEESLRTGIPFGFLNLILANQSNISNINEQVTGLTEDIKSKANLLVGKNLFDKNDVITGQALAFSDASDEIRINTDFNTGATSNFIPIVPGTTYHLHRINRGNAVSTFFKSDKKTYLRPLNPETNEPLTNNELLQIDVAVKAPDGAAYYMFTVKLSDYDPTSGDEDQFELGSSFTGYESYKMSVPFSELPSELNGLEERVAELEEEKTGGNNNPLYGKKISWDGDSICAGAGFAGGYAKIIAERNNMISINEAVGGGTIAAETYGSDGTTPRHWISRSVATLPEDSDYIIVEGGVNDSGDNMGEITNYFDYEPVDTTFYGGMESICKTLYSRFPGKKVGFIIVHQVSNWSAYRDTPKYKAVIDVCKKWGIPVLDLNILCPPLGLLPNDNSLRLLYTKDGDGWHPNEDGYKKFYCDKIEFWLKSL